MLEGPNETLTLTENAQPALMAVSLAVMRVLEARRASVSRERVKFVAGHSLGEYSALAAAGAFSVADAARLLKIARPGHAGGRAGRAGRDGGAARRRHGGGGQGRRGRRPGRCLPGRQRQRADAGRAVRRQDARSIAWPRARQGARRAPRHAAADVSAPFHCALMQPAAEAMAEALAKVDHQGASGAARRQRAGAADLRPGRDQEAPRRAGDRHGALARMRRSTWPRNGVTDVYEIGTGKVLAGLAKRIEPTLNATSLGTPADIDAAIATLQRLIEDEDHVRSDRQDRARHRRHRRHRRRHRHGALHKQGATVAISGRQADKLEKLAGRARRPRASSCPAISATSATRSPS